VATTKFRILLSFVALAFVLSAVGVAQDKKPATPPPGEKKPDEAKKDEKAQPPAGDPFAQAAALAPQHEALKPLIGSWNVKVRFWMDPAAPPSESTGTFERKALLGGRFLQEEFTGSFMGQPFSGIGHVGYDTMKKKYVSSWMDNMSTGIMTSSGDADASGKVITLISTEVNPMTGAKDKSVLRILNNDKNVVEMYVPGPDGKDVKTLEVESTRR